MGPSKDDLAKLRSEHGDVWTLRAPGLADDDGNQADDDVIVVRRPNLAETERLTDELFDDAKKSKAMQKLVKCVRVWPDQAAFDALIAARPLLLLSFAKPVQKIAGLVDEVELKKA